ncbi:DUF5681 domain-containing protein [Sphingomonas sp. CFBP 13720]|uniref:DUF5681 domain-containing protein n=1 Tax=Sphingomonas sp. CFBP 13720 TaxID=2775302 RepID=UPI0017815B76|nr:DUF5681 domain-containing protein [Sphingomonas sp. CFBP 13720]MBD8678317.1 hypothetical protein [Sphingomonas sp. CFBP 13720]
MPEETDGPVGYRNPPKHSRFRKGGPQPKRQKNTGAELDAYALLNETVTVQEGDRSRKIHPHELGLRQLARKAIKGDLSAIELSMNEFERYDIISARTPGSNWPTRLYVPVDCDPDEWHENLTVYGPPPWPLEHDGIARIQELRDAVR